LVLSGFYGCFSFLKKNKIFRLIKSDVYAQRQIEYKCNGSCGAKGCSVNWRNVWAGAVIGLVANGTRGAVIGCAGGTVALPVFGTAGGCIGGAVFGGTAGFVTGTLTTVAAELLTSCGR